MTIQKTGLVPVTSSLNLMHNFFYKCAEAYFVLLPISYIFCIMHFNSYAIVAILILVNIITCFHC